ncbi:hypothetical protein M407DRAFT_17131 [Tulasnella calospora MUT 4182]|uniref:F-box domain-containing protein n=1 Tax=Tulasnella calospora MUT 4182 TaxID=1051891 RepID=A0A0C3QYB8_9AGAM|nr:hypothetical protein M407DRAFT_17131 [Tulasnella calospora MUT 4182]
MAIGEDSINGLPTELLCEIFYLTIDSRDPPGDRCRLSLVCRLWRECIEGSALLWTDISARNARTYVRQALERSRGATINLNYSVHGNPKMTLEAFLVEAAPHTARWRSKIRDFGTDHA